MSNIVCPNCKHEFALTDSLDKEWQEARKALHTEIETERKNFEEKLENERIALRNKMETFLKAKQKEYEDKVIENEKEKILAEQVGKQKALAEYQLKLKAMEDEKKEKQLMVENLQRTEIALLKEKNELEQKNKDVELEIEKRLLQGRKIIEQELLQKEQERHDLKMKEKDTQLESMKRTIEDLKRKSEQGSMQAQGEAQELMLEEALKESFPFDQVLEIKKGAEGADCVLEINNRLGQKCGSIIFESKNAKHWNNDWITKLKTDKRNKSADIAILVTQVFPKNVKRFTDIEGVWVCSFNEVLPLVQVLRQGVMQVYEANKNQENKGDKMVMLYEFLTSNEFKGQIEGILEGFQSMRSSIDKERITMEKIWKEREKQIQKVLISTSGMFGSIKGIAGNSIGDINLLEFE
jgi:hypothetical protein